MGTGTDLMNTETGEIRKESALAMLSPEERAKYVPVGRPLTTREIVTAQVDRYSPCGCGSGKKFKFCCYRPA